MYSSYWIPLKQNYVGNTVTVTVPVNTQKVFSQVFILFRISHSMWLRHGKHDPGCRVGWVQGVGLVVFKNWSVYHILLWFSISSKKFIDTSNNTEQVSLHCTSLEFFTFFFRSCKGIDNSSLSLPGELWQSISAQIN